MPLPAALAAKLSRRGLITSGSKGDKETLTDYKGVLGCPNKNNIYHECSNWCHIHWKGFIAPDPQYVRNIKRMLEKYSLPSNWTEIFDKGIGRYYYWDMETDMVSWLPPKHPSAVITESAAKIRMKLHIPQANKDPLEKDPERKREHRDRHHRDRRDRENREEDRRQRHEDRDRERDRSRRRNARSDDLDPMDPAAYSDVPRGSWTDGLENNKSKADTTASGALFQQRPYPAPGEVLNANKQKTKKKS